MEMDNERIDIPLSNQADLCVGNGKYLRLLESVFKVRIEIDGDRIVIIGNAAANVCAASSISALISLLDRGETLDVATVEYIAALSNEGRLSAFLSSADVPILQTHKGKSIRSKTLGQRVYLDAASKSDIILCIGPAGTGKTYLGVALAVAAFKKREVSRIILARPAVEAGERLGFLPGDIKEKVDPYMRPIYDALFDLLGEEAFLRYSEKGLIEVSPLAFMRGRTLDDAYVLLDEAQNTTVEQMKMFLTRIGLNARAIVCGDITQVDLPKGVQNGLSDAAARLLDIPGISVITLADSDIVRNPLVQKIIKAYND